MKAYNGFSPEQRNEAGAWLNRQFASGAVERPSRCCACGQDAGVIDAHAEDYSKPFGPHIYEFPLCYRCHMMVHCRFAARAAWSDYLAALARGVQFPPFMRRDWTLFKATMLENGGDWHELPVGAPASGVHVLVEIAAGAHRPKVGGRGGPTDQERDGEAP